MEGKSSQHGFAKGKSCLTNLVVFYEGMTRQIDERRAAHIFYLEFSKVFDTASHKTACLQIGWHTGRLCCHPTQSGQTGEQGKGDFHEVQ